MIQLTNINLWTVRFTRNIPQFKPRDKINTYMDTKLLNTPIKIEHESTKTRYKSTSNFPTWALTIKNVFRNIVKNSITLDL